METEIAEPMSYTYVAQRMCPFSLSGAPGHVHLYMEDDEIQSARDPSAISKHFKCTDAEVEEQRQIVFAKQDREKERQRQMEELERVEQSAPMVAAERIVQKIAELGRVPIPVAAPVPAGVETGNSGEPAGELVNPTDTGGDVEVSTTDADASDVEDPVTSGSESTPGE